MIMVDEEAMGRFRKLLDLSDKRSGLGIPDPTMTVDELHKELKG